MQDDAHCSKACGGGKKKKTFHVIENAAYGGDDSACKDVSGSWLDEEFVDCNAHACPVPCQGKWVPTGDCMGGKRRYTFRVTVPEAHGGACAKRNAVYDAACN